MLIADRDVMKVYGALVNGGDADNAGELLSDYIEKAVAPLRAKSDEIACGSTYDPWDELDEGDEPMHRCNLRAGHETSDTPIHAEIDDSGGFQMSWTKG